MGRRPAARRRRRRQRGVEHGSHRVRGRARVRSAGRAAGRPGRHRARRVGVEAKRRNAERREAGPRPRRSAPSCTGGRGRDGWRGPPRRWGDAVAQVGHGGGGGGIVAPGRCGRRRRGPAPMAKSSSVVAGMSETMRRAAARRPRPCRPHRPRCRRAGRRRADGAAGGEPRAAAPASAANRTRVPEMETARPRGRGRAVRDGELAPSTRHQPSPEGIAWWRERRGLLASGLRSPSRLPSGVVSEESASERPCPLQWRGRAGIAPASERPHSRTSIVSSRLKCTGPARAPQERARARALSRARSAA